MIRAANDPSASQSVLTITEKAPTRALFWFKDTILNRHYPIVSRREIGIWDANAKVIRDGQVVSIDS